MEHFQETVKIDTAQNTEKIIVPAHGDRQHMELLNDFNVVKICYFCFLSFAERIHAFHCLIPQGWILK